LSYNHEIEDGTGLSLELTFNDSELLFAGVRELEIRLEHAVPNTDEVIVRSVHNDRLEGLNYHVTSDQGALEFHFYCKDVQGRSDVALA
jgi:hypothetical protein